MPDGSKVSELTEITTIADADLLYVSTSGGLSRRITRANFLDSLALPDLTPTLTISDSATLAPLNVTERSTAPTSPASNDVYLDDGTNTGSGQPGWRRYTGAAWEDLSGGVVVGAGISSGTANRVLYEDSGNLLAESANFTFDGNSVVLAGSNVVRLTVNANASQSANILEVYNGSAALRARITAAAAFSNTGGQTNGETFGALASVTGTNGSAFGNGASASTDALAVGQGAAAGSANAIALGHGASVSSADGIALGTDASAAGDSIALGRAATNTANNQMVVGSTSMAINSVFIGNGVTNASPSALVVNGTGGSGTDVAGAAVTIAGGRGTGSGAGGTVKLQYAPAGGSGSSLNALADRIVIDSTGVNVTGDTLVIADSASIPPLNVTPRDTEPSAPVDGDLYLDDGTNTMDGFPGWRFFNGITWGDASGLGTGIDDGAMLYYDSAIFPGNRINTTERMMWNTADEDLYLGNGITSATPSSNDARLNATGGSGTNIAGAPLYLAGGRGTGTGAGGSVILQVAPAGTSGSSLNSLVSAVTVAETGVVIGNLPAAAVPLRINAHASQSGHLIECYDGTSTLRAHITEAGAFQNGTSQNLLVGEGASVSANDGNTVIGVNAVSIGNSADTVLGAQARAEGSATALGRSAFAGGNSVAVGFAAGATGLSGGAPIDPGVDRFICIGHGAFPTANDQCVIGGTSTTINAVYFGKGVVHATPTTVTINATGGSGTDIAGADLTLAAGRPTGAGTPGSLLLQAAIADAGTGTTLNGLSTGFELTADTSELLLAFFGATPVGQAAHAGTPSGTDAAVISAIITALVNYGLMAAP